MSEDGKFVAYKLKENGVKVLQRDVQTQKMHELLEQYQILLADAGVFSALVFTLFTKGK